jgi:hypothetical protein
MLRSNRLKICGGTELLDELTNILSNLYSFNKDNDLEFASTITLLHRYWDNLKERTDNNSELRSEFIRILHKMATILYGEVNIPVACGARVIACDVESSYLNDEEAQLVRCITGIHIDRATSIVQALKAEGPAIVSCVVPADELPNFPHVDLEKAGNFAKAKIKETILAITGR